MKSITLRITPVGHTMVRATYRGKFEGERGISNPQDDFGLYVPRARRYRVRYSLDPKGTLFYRNGMVFPSGHFTGFRVCPIERLTQWPDACTLSRTVLPWRGRG